jgi:hypothetical protein
LLLSDPGHRRRDRATRFALRARTSTLGRSGRFLGVGRRDRGKHDGCSESARCASDVATRQGRTSIDAGVAGDEAFPGQLLRQA